MKISVLSPAELQDRRDAIFALLEERPYSTTELARLLGLRNGAIAPLLRRFTREQQVHRTADDRWCLGARPAKVTPAPEAAPPLDELEEDLDVDTALDDEDLDARPVGRPALRHPMPTNTIAADIAPSWWTTAPQEGFSQRATVEHKRMRGSKEAHFVPFRMLQ